MMDRDELPTIPVPLKLTKDGETVIISFTLPDSDIAHHFASMMATMIAYGCVHFHTVDFGRDDNDEVMEAMKEKRGHHTH